MVVVWGGQCCQYQHVCVHPVKKGYLLEVALAAFLFSSPVILWNLYIKFISLLSLEPVSNAYIQNAIRSLEYLFYNCSRHNFKSLRHSYTTTQHEWHALDMWKNKTWPFWQDK